MVCVLACRSGPVDFQRPRTRAHHCDSCRLTTASRDADGGTQPDVICEGGCRWSRPTGASKLRFAAGRGRRAPRPRRRTHRHQDRSIVASDQGWLKSGALLTFPPDGAGLCRAWLRERLAGSPAYRARSSAVTVSTTASRMPNVTSNQNESPADADKISDITISLLLIAAPSRHLRSWHHNLRRLLPEVPGAGHAYRRPEGVTTSS